MRERSIAPPSVGSSTVTLESIAPHRELAITRNRLNRADAAAQSFVTYRRLVISFAKHAVSDSERQIKKDGGF